MEKEPINDENIEINEGISRLISSTEHYLKLSEDVKAGEPIKIETMDSWGTPNPVIETTMDGIFFKDLASDFLKSSKFESGENSNILEDVHHIGMKAEIALIKDYLENYTLPENMEDMKNIDMTLSGKIQHGLASHGRKLSNNLKIREDVIGDAILLVIRSYKSEKDVPSSFYQHLDKEEVLEIKSFYKENEDSISGNDEPYLREIRVHTELKELIEKYKDEISFGNIQKELEELNKKAKDLLS